jgi:hypothetical protein
LLSMVDISSKICIMPKWVILFAQKYFIRNF